VLRTGVAAVLSMAAWEVGRDQSRPVREACDATYSVRPAARSDELFSLAHANTNRPLRSYARDLIRYVSLGSADAVGSS
jgi:hypothetical protein